MLAKKETSLPGFTLSKLGKDYIFKDQKEMLMYQELLNRILNQIECKTSIVDYPSHEKYAEIVRRNEIRTIKQGLYDLHHIVEETAKPSNLFVSSRLSSLEEVFDHFEDIELSYESLLSFNSKYDGHFGLFCGKFPKEILEVVVNQDLERCEMFLLDFCKKINKDFEVINQMYVREDYEEWYAALVYLSNATKVVHDYFPKSKDPEELHNKCVNEIDRKTNQPDACRIKRQDFSKSVYH